MFIINLHHAVHRARSLFHCHEDLSTIATSKWTEERSLEIACDEENDSNANEEFQNNDDECAIRNLKFLVYIMRRVHVVYLSIILRETLPSHEYERSREDFKSNPSGRRKTSKIRYDSACGSVLLASGRADRGRNDFSGQDGQLAARYFPVSRSKLARATVRRD